jgi:hypothetical protein
MPTSADRRSSDSSINSGVQTKHLRSPLPSRQKENFADAAHLRFRVCFRRIGKRNHTIDRNLDEDLLCEVRHGAGGYKAITQGVAMHRPHGRRVQPRRRIRDR